MSKAKESAPIRGGLVKCALAALGLILWSGIALALPNAEHAEMLYTVTMVRTTASTGSGTVIYSAKRDGECVSFVLTNFHVVESAIAIESEWSPDAGKKVDRERRDQVRVEWWDYNGLSRAVGTRGKQADIEAYDKAADLALLRLVDRERCVSPVAYLLPENAAIHTFDPVWAVGAGLGRPPFPTFGYIANLDTLIDGYRYQLSSAPIIFGNSGGALFRHSTSRNRYELIGVPSKMSAAGFGAAVSHMAWSIPMETVYRFLRANKAGFVVPAEAK